MDLGLYFKCLLGIAFGGFIIYHAGYEILSWLKQRSRLARVPGVIIGKRDTRGELGMGPATYSRAAIFRFTTRDGQVIEAESRLSSFPGPKPGKKVTVVYDPNHPDEADTTGRKAVYLIIGMIIFLVGVALVVISLVYLF